MANKRNVKSPFQDYKVNVIIGDGRWEWGGGKGPTRAVVELSRDCRFLMPHLSKAIAGSGYSDAGDSLGFHYEDMSVLIEARRITMIGAEDVERARMLMGWLGQISALTIGEFWIRSS